MQKKGLFITFEGTDGCGKTTQLNMAAEFLKSKGYEVVITREPGALETGKKIRQILLHSEEKLSDYCEMFLFLADRAQHVEALIKPAVEQGKIVLCDRHKDSHIAYQGYGREKNAQLIKELNQIAVNGIEPDLTLLYCVSPEVAMKRLSGAPDRIEAEGTKFQERVLEGYKKIAKENPERIKVINADNSVETVYNDTKNTIIELIEKKFEV
ncbi:dTMP kinase [bacterium]|nr:dTMP kinase [bacterium]